MSAIDGGQWILTYTDQSGTMVPKDRVGRTGGVEQADLILIGDSFMQADEMPWEERMGQLIARASGLKVETIGYSSWAPATQTNWLFQQPLARGVHVAYFMMTNDLTPTYPNSNLQYHAELPGQPFPLTFQPKRADEPSEAISLDWRSELMARSFFLSRGRAAVEAFLSPRADSGVRPLLLARELAAPRTCADVSKAAAQLPAETWLLDYVLLALPQDCWPEPMREGVDGAIDDVAAAYEHVRSLGGSMHVYLIPAGWAFENENMVGKAAMPQFGLAPDATVGQAGVARYIAEAPLQRGIPFDDLQPIIASLKAEKPGNYYFPADGHWTPLTHRLLAPRIMSDAGISVR